MKRINIGFAAGAALMISLFASCDRAVAGEEGGPPTAGDSEAPVVFAVNTTRAVRGPIQDYLPLSGDLVAGTVVDAFSEVAGKVTKLNVSVGDRVRKDDPIAEVDPSRPGMTFMPGVVRAPISGTIVALPVQVGMTISPAVPVARLSGIGGLELEVHVAERFISKMRVGLRAELSLDAYPGRTFRGTIREISPVVDPASRTLELRLRVENTGALLKAGMFAKVKVITEEKPSVVKIPSEALVRRFGETYVFTVESDPSDPAFRVARRRVIVPGILIDNQLEVLEGLGADQEIVIRGQTLLEDGSRVNVVDRN